MRSKIVLTRLKFDGLYFYNNLLDTYSNVLGLNQEFYNYVIKNQVLSSDGSLYESLDYTLCQFKVHYVDIEISDLNFFFYLDYKNYMYFMDMKYYLIESILKLKKSRRFLLITKKVFSPQIRHQSNLKYTNRRYCPKSK